MADYSIDIIKQLNTGLFVSGKNIATSLNISRSRVCQIINKLKLSGLHIDAVVGKGYKLTEKVELLNEPSIRHYINDNKNTPALKVFTHIDSTNQYIIKNHKNMAHQSVVLAESQSAGRGRRGKNWLGTFSGSLMMSFYHEFSFPSSQLTGLSLVTGLAVVNALNDLGIDAQIKWPNDLYVNNKKLAGILIDIISSNKQQSKVVTGIGINIRIPSLVRDQIDQDVIDLCTLDNEFQYKRNQITAYVISHVNQKYERFNKKGFSDFLHEWQAHDLLKNKAVQIEQQNEVMKGIAKGVTENGALKVSINGQTSILYSGEVSLKLS